MTDNKLAYKIFELADAFQGSATLFFAVQNGIFDLLETPTTSFEIAKKMNWLEWKTTIFLNALVSLDLIEKNDIFFSNTNLASNTLVRNKKSYQGDIIEHERLQWKLWSTMGEILTSDNATSEQQNIRLEQENYDNHVFHNAMLQLAEELIEYVVCLDIWQNKKMVIDLAGGHGLYLAKLTNLHRSIIGEVWDLKSAENAAKTVFRTYNLENQLTFKQKDITLKSSYAGVKCDGILINHCLHHFTPSQVSEMIDNCVRILEIGGCISLVESYLESNLVSPRDSAMFSLYMMVNRVNGQVHATEWIANELKKHGLLVTVNRLKNPGDDALIIATKVK